MSVLAHGAEGRERIGRPPLIFVSFLVFGAVLQFASPYPVLSDWLRAVLALPAIVSGMALLASASRSFRTAGTGSRVHWPARVLVTAGPYRYSRNPMYLSMSLIYLGLAFAMNSLWALLLMVPLHLLLHVDVIQAEEASLEARFGEAYRRYSHRVRRWF